MRLLHAFKIELLDFPASRIPPYAILSHVWGENEVLFTHFENGVAAKQPGLEKIKKACKQTIEGTFDNN